MRRLLYKGDFDPNEVYVPGSITKHDDGSYKVWTRDDVWQPVQATPDPVLDRAPLDGKDGRDGVDGRNGVDGKDAANYNHRGEWKRGAYDTLDVVTLGGSSYVALAPTKAKPPGGVGWQLLAKAGTAGKDAPQSSISYVQRGARGPAGTVEQVETGFTESVALGDVIRIAGDGIASKALASGSDANALAVGVVSGPNSYQTHGPITNPAWNLTPGVPYYLSPTTPGAITSTAPTTMGEYVIIVGVALTPQKLSISIHWVVYLAT